MNTDQITAEYDDLLPVCLHKANDGVYHLLDRHSDEIATFDQAIEHEDMERIVRLINNQCRVLNTDQIAAEAADKLLLRISGNGRIQTHITEELRQRFIESHKTAIEKAWWPI